MRQFEVWRKHYIFGIIKAMKTHIKHWSVDTAELRKDKKAFSKWNLENAINFGMRNGKINENELRENFDILNLDPHKRRFLSLLLA